MSQRKLTDIFMPPAAKRRNVSPPQTASDTGSPTALQTQDPATCDYPHRYVVLPPANPTDRWDIGHFVGSHPERHEMYHLLRNPWVPEKGFEFPVQVRTVKGKAKNLAFQDSWLDRFPWLTYSQVSDGAFCRFCVIFAGDVAGGNPLKVLVREPLKNWKDAIEICNSHSTTKYHRDCELKAISFQSSHESGDVHEQLQTGFTKQKARNRAVVSAVIEVIKLCGRQGLALRGKRDAGPLIEPGLYETGGNEGNFRAILRLVAHHDPKLEAAIKGMPSNATYLSPSIQNEIIDTCGSMIRQQIVQKVKNSIFYSILADETADIAQQEQFSLCLRYVSDGKIREDFVGFQSTQDLTGAGLAELLLTKIPELGLDVQMIRGQGYDGASNMAGQFRGVQARIKEVNPLAVYTHCSSHCLSLACAKAGCVPLVSKLLARVSTVCNFFRESPKRAAVLQQAIKALLPSQRHSKLISLCPTRWVERHEALSLFSEMLPAILHALQSIKEDGASSTADKADALWASVHNFQFIIALKTTTVVFSHCVNISKALQSTSCDLIAATEMIKSLIVLYEDMRTDAEQYFGEIFAHARDLALEYDITLTIPSIGRRKLETGGLCIEAHYRVHLFVALLDTFVAQLKSRFDYHFQRSATCYAIIPHFMGDHDPETELLPFLDQYQGDLPPRDLVLAEVRQWKRKWEAIGPEENKPSTAIEALNAADPLFFPGLHISFKILSTLPVTTAAAERSFSTLNRLKSYLRNSMGAERLNGLAMLNIHREIKLPTEEVLENFRLATARRLDLTL